MSRKAGFAPVVDANTRLLILGSLPGERSIELQQYYAQSRNAFWRITGEIFGFGADDPYDERIAALTEGTGLAPFMSIVREALVTSVTCLPVSWRISQVSTVPKWTSPASARRYTRCPARSTG